MGFRLESILQDTGNQCPHTPSILAFLKYAHPSVCTLQVSIICLILKKRFPMNGARLKTRTSSRNAALARMDCRRMTHVQQLPEPFRCQYSVLRPAMHCNASNLNREKKSNSAWKPRYLWRKPSKCFRKFTAAKQWADQDARIGICVSKMAEHPSMMKSGQGDPARAQLPSTSEKSINLCARISGSLWGRFLPFSTCHSERSRRSWRPLWTCTKWLTSLCPGYSLPSWSSIVYEPARISVNRREMTQRSCPGS